MKSLASNLISKGMPRCLIALEFGGNLGHLTRCLALAKQLRSMGCEVLFAVPESRAAFETLAPHGFAYIAAPRVHAVNRKAPQPINYADLLLQKGYADPAALHASVHSWSSVIGLFRPDVVIADFAPTALLAARVIGLPAVAIGNGFFIPPNVSPWPSIRPWDDVSHARLQAADDALLANINAVLRKWQKPGMHAPADLFADVLRILATFAALDHYGTRSGEHYAGVFYGLDAGQKLDWPAGDGKRVLVYLRPDVPGFGALLQSLHASQHKIVFAAPGTHAAHIPRFSAAHLHFTNSPVALAPLLANADLAVGYGSIGFVAQTLRAGVPQLMLPSFVEQALFARQVNVLGAGISLTDDRDEARCTDAIDGLLSEPRYRQAAAKFAAQHQHYDQAAATRAMAGQIIQWSAAPVSYAIATPALIGATP